MMTQRREEAVLFSIETRLGAEVLTVCSRYHLAHAACRGDSRASGKKQTLLHSTCQDLNVRFLEHAFVTSGYIVDRQTSGD